MVSAVAKRRLAKRRNDYQKTRPRFDSAAWHAQQAGDAARRKAHRRHVNKLLTLAIAFWVVVVIAVYFGWSYGAQLMNDLLITKAP